MNSRGRQVWAWAGLAETPAEDPRPVPWKTAVRTWILVYPVSTFVMAGIFWTTEALMGGGVHDAAETLAPGFGWVTYMWAVNGGARTARSTAAVRGGRIRPGTWEKIITFTAFGVMAIAADALVHQPSGWTAFGLSLGLSTLACIVFVAATRMRSVRPQPA